MTVETAIKTFYVEFCRTTPYISLHCDVVPVSVVLGVVSQLPKLWRNDSGSTGKQKTLRRDFRVFVYMPKNAINAIWRLTLHHVLTEPLELKFLRENIAFVLDNKCK